MRQLKIILLLVAFSCSVFAQDRLSLFISRANKYASVELSDYRKRLCVEYNMSNNSLDDYYRRCGRNWGNVGLALEIARTSGRHMRDVCDYYKRYHRHGWDRVLIEIGIRPGSTCYKPFYDRIHYHSNCWHEHYCSYCDHHDKHHYKHHKKLGQKTYHIQCGSLFVRFLYVHLFTTGFCMLNFRIKQITLYKSNYSKSNSSAFHFLHS